MPTRNLFTRFKFDVDDNTTFSDLDIDESLIDDQSVEVILTGTRENVDRVFHDPKWDNFETFFTPRSFKKSPNYTAKQSALIVDMSRSHTMEDDFVAYADSGFADLGNIPKAKILETIQRLKGAAHA